MAEQTKEAARIPDNITSRRSLLGMFAAAPIAAIAVPASAQAFNDPWADLAKGMSALHPKGADAVNHAREAGMLVSELYAVIAGGTGANRILTVMFKEMATGDLRNFVPEGEEITTGRAA